MWYELKPIPKKNDGPSNPSVPFLGTILLNKKLHLKLLNIQKEHFNMRLRIRNRRYEAPIPKTPTTLLVGCYNRKIVTDFAYINKCRYLSNSDCKYQPELNSSALSRAVNNLVKKKLIPCGIIKVFPYYEIVATFGGAGDDFREFVGRRNLSVYAIGKGGMTIETIISYRKGSYHYGSFGWKTV